MGWGWWVDKCVYCSTHLHLCWSQPEKNQPEKKHKHCYLLSLILQNQVSTTFIWHHFADTKCNSRIFKVWFIHFWMHNGQGVFTRLPSTQISIKSKQNWITTHWTCCFLCLYRVIAYIIYFSSKPEKAPPCLGCYSINK